MWKWNVAVIGIVVIGAFVMFQILLDLPTIDESTLAEPRPQSDTASSVAPTPAETNFDTRLLDSATLPLQIGDVQFRASVADTGPTRQLGLSNTTAIPPDVAKLLVFDTNDIWGIWMKDMKYAIDIIWLDQNKQVVHIEENATPASYPTVFLPTAPNRYVIEVAAGMVAETGVVVGDMVQFDR